MKKIKLTLALASLLAGINVRAQTDLFSTIQNWTGTGANEAGLVIDWYNGTSSEALMWGYRWNGTATGEQMFDAIVASDPRLFAEESGFDTGFGTIVFGLGYSATGDVPITLTPGLSFNSQHLAFADSYSAEDDSRTAVNGGDLWQEGWDDGYWALYSSTDARLSVNESDWDFASTGITDQTLENGDFDGYIFAPGFNSPNPSNFTPAPVPEPTVLALMALGGLGMANWRKKS